MISIGEIAVGLNSSGRCGWRYFTNGHIIDMIYRSILDGAEYDVVSFSIDFTPVLRSGNDD